MAKYYYNGIIYPELKWDKTSYPYAFMRMGYAYVFPTPFPALNSGSMEIKAPFLRSKLQMDESNHEYWTEWETITEDMEINGSISWASHDVIKSDGSTYLAASDPVPVSFPVVVYDGEKTTTGSYGFPAANFSVFDSLGVGDRVIITINGVTDEYTVKKVQTSTQSLIGNAGLNGNDREAEDDGGEWLFATVGIVGLTRQMYFYTRTAGTYQIKIELLAPEPTLTEGDFYRVINGAWVKCDTVRKMGNEWVTQDEYRYE